MSGTEFADAQNDLIGRLPPGRPACIRPIHLPHSGWIDFNKNGVKDIFEDPAQPVDRRIADLLSQMTLEEKTCQAATLYGYGRVLKDSLPAPER